MKFRLMILPMIASMSVLSGCAYYQGLHYQDNTAKPKTVNGKTVTVPASPAGQAATSSQPNAASTAAKMISPMTQQVH